MIDLPVIPPSLGQDCYPSSAQAFVNEAVGNARVQLDNSGFSVVLNQEATPSATQRTYLWRKPSTGLTYNWDAAIGAWVCFNFISSAGGSERRLFEGALADIATYDGGSVGTVGAASGPMWERDTNYNGRSPMGVGAIASTNPAKSLAESESYGSGSATLAVNNLPASFSLTGTWEGYRTNIESGAAQWFGPPYAGSITTPSTHTLPISFTNTGGDQPLQLVHPVRGCYVLKRTARTHYRA